MSALAEISLTVTHCPTGQRSTLDLHPQMGLKPVEWDGGVPWGIVSMERGAVEVGQSNIPILSLSRKS